MPTSTIMAWVPQLFRTYLMHFMWYFIVAGAGRGCSSQISRTSRRKAWIVHHHSLPHLSPWQFANIIIAWHRWRFDVCPLSVPREENALCRKEIARREGFYAAEDPQKIPPPKRNLIVALTYPFQQWRHTRCNAICSGKMSTWPVVYSRCICA